MKAPLPPVACISSIILLLFTKFNEIKNKKAYHNYETRKQMLEAIRYVDLVIPENTWDQKIDDVKTYQVDTVVMGSDWKDSERFECLRPYCEVVYLDRTEGVSTTQIKNDLKLQDPINGIDQLPEEKEK